MALDFQSRALRPGEPLQAGTVRGWLESRSRITNHQAHVRWVWAVGAIWDGCCCRSDINRRWLVGFVRCGSLGTSTSLPQLRPSPEPHPPRDEHSSLLDPRWVELFLSHVKEMDTYQETKKKLARGGSSSAAPRADVEAKAKPKPKAKSKGKGKGRGADAEGEAPAQP